MQTWLHLLHRSKITLLGFFPYDYYVKHTTQPSIPVCTKSFRSGVFTSQRIRNNGPMLAQRKRINLNSCLYSGLANTAYWPSTKVLGLFPSKNSRIPGSTFRVCVENNFAMKFPTSPEIDRPHVDGAFFKYGIGRFKLGDGLLRTMKPDSTTSRK